MRPWHWARGTGSTRTRERSSRSRLPRREPLADCPAPPARAAGRGDRRMSRFRAHRPPHHVRRREVPRGQDPGEAAHRRWVPGRRMREERGLRLLLAGGTGALVYPPRSGSSTQLARDRLVNAPLRALLEAGVRDGVFPAAQASVFHHGREVGRAAVGAAEETPFDLASLTKILCTASAFVGLWAEGRVGPSTPVSRWIDGSPLAKNDATLGDLLTHRSGLPAWQPFFAVVLHTVPELRRADCPASTRLTVRSEVRDAAARSPLDVPPGTRTLYSDIGFLLAGEMLAEAAGAPLDALHARISERLGASTHFHRLSTRGQDDRDPCGGRWDALPPTGAVRPRPPAPGQENRWESLPSDPSPPGEVDDDNAWVMDGVSGHAGLFGTATEVA